MTVCKYARKVVGLTIITFLSMKAY